jgi:hypothetical protein
MLVTAEKGKKDPGLGLEDDAKPVVAAPLREYHLVAHAISSLGARSSGVPPRCARDLLARGSLFRYESARARQFGFWRQAGFGVSCERCPAADAS